MNIITNSRLAPNNLLAIYFSWIIALSVGYFVATQENWNTLVPTLWLLIGLTGIGAIFFGVKQYRPAAWLGWLFLAAANILFIAGDTHFNVHEYIYFRPNDFPSLADAFYLATYPFFIAGMFVLIRRRVAGHSERKAVLDAAIFTLGLAMFVWVYLVIPNVTAEASLTVRLLSVAYPLFDILVWAMLVRLLLTGVKVVSVQFLLIGALGLLVSDILYGLNQFYGVWSNGSFIDIGWICFYTFWGAAALHPSMKFLDKPVAEPAVVSLRPLILLAATALVAPTLLLVETIRGNAETVSITLAVFSAILFMLVILRMGTLVRALSQGEAEIAMEKKKNEAFSIVSHQLKTPVSVVTQLLGMMLDDYAGKISGRQRKLLEESYAVNQRLLRIVEDLLNVGQIDSGSLKLHKTNTDVVRLMRDVVHEQKPKIAERKQKIKCEFSDRQIMARIDDERIKMVFENLLDNASKYSPPSKEVNIGILKLKKYAKITVKDYGVGIDQSDLEKLFQKFSRIDNPLSDSVGGTGLGLYWAKKIVDEHGGSIKVKSKPDRGSSFVITLPI